MSVYSSFSFIYIVDFCESTKLRGLRALLPYVPRALHALVSCVLCALRTSCPTCLVSSVLSCPACSRALRASCHTYSRTSRTSFPTYSLASHVSCPTCFCASRTFVLTYLMPYVASCFISLFSAQTLMSRTLHTLRPNATFRALEFPCLTHLFFCLFAACDFLGVIFLKLKQI